jgi:hypothetical protein
MKHWWVVHKVNPEMDTHRNDAYMERHDDDDVIHVYQEENEGDQGLRFTISDGVGLIELATHDVELMEDEPGPSKNAFRNQNDSLKNKNDVIDLMHVPLKQIYVLMTFDKYNLLLSLYIYPKICY